MVDALVPAADALEANADNSLLDALKAAEVAAKQGVEDTKKYVAKFGRAKSLLERANRTSGCGSNFCMADLPGHERICGR